MSRESLDDFFPIDPPKPQWKDAERTKEEAALDDEGIPFRERTRWVSAARCRECDVVTWKISLSGGRKKTRKSHRDGCSEPAGKFDRAEVR